MAESSMKDIKLRIRSVQSTRQITKAMQLVATSKMRRSREKMERSKPYAQISMEAFAQVLAHCKDSSLPYITQREVKKRLFVVVAGDRGLAGGYNSNIFKLVAAECGDVPYDVLPVGRKAMDKYNALGVNCISSDYFPVAGMKVGTCFKMASRICEGYKKGEWDEVILCYTDFKSMLSQEATVRKLLPISKPDEPVQQTVEPIYEPDPETMIESIVPDMLAGTIYSCISDAAASENAARRNAMDSATKNADEMISGLQLKYNRARQGSITQEITEIVAGSQK